MRHTPCNSANTMTHDATSPRYVGTDPDGEDVYAAPCPDCGREVELPRFESADCACGRQIVLALMPIVVNSVEAVGAGR